MSDGQLGLNELLKLLTSKYNVIAITDHDTLTIPHPLHRRGIRKKHLLLRGIEYSAAYLTHLVGLEPTQSYGTSVEIWQSCRVKWIAHPGLSGLSETDIDTILATNSGINGIEMFNSGILQVKDNTNSFHGCNFYSSDDLHEPYQIRASWMEMDVPSLDKELIINKLVNGDYTICTSNSSRNPLQL